MNAKATPLERNALVDLNEVLHDLNREFLVGDFALYEDEGIELDLAARAFILNEEARKRNEFINELGGVIETDGALSARQMVTALNLMRNQVLQLKPDTRPEDDPSIDPAFSGRFRCGHCAADKVIVTFDHRADLIDHKVAEHDYQPAKGSLDRAIIEPESVLEEPAPTWVDLSELHDGFYLIPDASLNGRYGGCRALKVRRTTTQKKVDNKRFVYGTKIVGNEIVPLGSIEVKLIVSETMELVGRQKPGDYYRGRFPELLEKILEHQDTYAEFFAMKETRCFICGARLEDETSQLDLLGPECVRNYKSKEAYMKLNPSQLHREKCEKLRLAKDARRDAKEKREAEQQMKGMVKTS